jgi:hypothetical protein
MHYMLLIYENEAEQERQSQEEQQHAIAAHTAFANDLRVEGRFVAGDPLHPSASATCVRHRNGSRLLIDGPYAETREQLGGFYIIEAKDLDQALADAGRMPVPESTVIEVRPIIDFSA